MSFQNNTAVDVYQNFVLPTALDSDFSSEDLADDMDGLQLTMQRVKIPGGGNLQFEIRSDDPDTPNAAAVAPQTVCTNLNYKATLPQDIVVVNKMRAHYCDMLPL